MPNSIDFYKGIFLHVTPICIIVPCNKTLISDSSLNTDYLKNRIIELGNHLSEKNAVINYLTMQLIPKSQDKEICSCNHNNNHKNKINKDEDSDTQLEIEDPSKKLWL